MAERNYPGVYVEEVAGGPGPIRGVSTSNLGLVGFTKKGLVNQPILVTSFTEFEQKFGSFTEKGLTPVESFAFFQNGGQRNYVVRVVSDDAIASWWDLVHVLGSDDAEILSNVVEPTGIYSLGVDNVPVVPGSLSALTFEEDGGTTVNIFEDDGAGNLTVASGTTGSGGSGSIDYETGEISVSLTNPADYPGGTDKITAVYGYRVFRFEMKWPGDAGDHYRVRITGSSEYEVPAEARFSRFNVLVDQDINEDATNRNWVTVEQFSALVFDDATDANFVATVINDDRAGSDIITVVDYGNAMNPADLAGTEVTGEDFSGTQNPAYDGATKTFAYAAVNAVSAKTFNAKFNFIESASRVGAGDGTATPSIQSPGSASAPVELAVGDGTLLGAKVKVNYTDAGDLAKVIADDGAGNLTDDGTPTGVVGGTVNYTTGEITIDLTTIGEVAKAGTDVTIDVEYVQPVGIVDDGNGNLSVDTPVTGAPTKFQLHPSATQTVDYDSGEFNLTWRIEGAPSAGPAGVTAEVLDYYMQPESSLSNVLAGGADGSSVDSSDIIGADLVAKEEGLYAFDQIDDMMQLVISDFQTDEIVSNSLIDYCELKKDKFAIITVPRGLEPQEAVNWKKFDLARSTSYAAVYYNHIKVIDPVSGTAVDIPVGGHVAGIYARTDQVRNVAKTPAGVQDGALRWLIGLERDVTPAHAGVVYPEKINPLVQWRQTGRVVWGGRTIDIPGGEFPYIAQRRLFIFLEKSVFNATHIHVFENNGPALWGKISTQVSSFMNGLFTSGYFAGTSASEAFFVICDETNNSQTTIDQGVVLCDVGVATNKPGEFIVFRFQQKALA